MDVTEAQDVLTNADEFIDPFIGVIPHRIQARVRIGGHPVRMIIHPAIRSLHGTFIVFKGGFEVVSFF